MTDDAEVVGERIRRWRINTGLTQRELAQAVGVHMNQVLAWEKGRHTPKVQRRPAIARALGVQPEVLFAVGEERVRCLEEAAQNVMLSIARKQDASPAQQLSAARGLMPKPATDVTTDAEAQLAAYRAGMDQLDSALARLQKKLDADENGTKRRR
jgi:transcriptional regulator with XRE-family HTH domain